MRHLERRSSKDTRSPQRGSLGKTEEMVMTLWYLEAAERRDKPWLLDGSRTTRVPRYNAGKDKPM